jgi:hypothetical protein
LGFLYELPEISTIGIGMHDNYAQHKSLPLPCRQPVLQAGP